MWSNICLYEGWIADQVQGLLIAQLSLGKCWNAYGWLSTESVPIQAVHIQELMFQPCPLERKLQSLTVSASKFAFITTTGIRSQFFHPLPASVLFFDSRDCLLHNFSTVQHFLNCWKGPSMSCSAKNLNAAKRGNSLEKLFPSQLSPAKWKTNETAALLHLLHKVIPLPLREEKSMEKHHWNIHHYSLSVHRAGLKKINTQLNSGQFWTSEFLKEWQKN